MVSKKYCGMSLPVSMPTGKALSIFRTGGRVEVSKRLKVDYPGYFENTNYPVQ